MYLHITSAKGGSGRTSFAWMLGLLRALDLAYNDSRGTVVIVDADCRALTHEVIVSPLVSANVLKFDEGLPYVAIGDSVRIVPIFMPYSRARVMSELSRYCPPFVFNGYRAAEARYADSGAFDVLFDHMAGAPSLGLAGLPALAEEVARSTLAAINGGVKGQAYTKLLLVLRPDPAWVELLRHWVAEFFRKIVEVCNADNRCVAELVNEIIGGGKLTLLFNLFDIEDEEEFKDGIVKKVSDVLENDFGVGLSRDGAPAATRLPPYAEVIAYTLSGEEGGSERATRIYTFFKEWFVGSQGLVKRGLVAPFDKEFYRVNSAAVMRSLNICVYLAGACRALRELRKGDSGEFCRNVVSGLQLGGRCEALGGFDTLVERLSRVGMVLRDLYVRLFSGGVGGW